MRPSVPEVHITDPRDAEYAAYRALAPQAVTGLIFGLLSPLALIDPLLWIMPALGLFFSCWAIRRIKKNSPTLTGRGMAMAGLTISLLIAVAAQTEWLVYRCRVRDEARQFSALWLRYLVQAAEPQKAHQLTMPPQRRLPFNNRLWDFYRNNPRPREALKGYVSSPTVRTLLALGPRSDVRFYDTAGQIRSDNDDQVEQLYAVTYEEDGERKSFFVAVRMSRPKLAGGKTGWRIISAEGGVIPKGLEKAESPAGVAY